MGFLNWKFLTQLKLKWLWLLLLMALIAGISIWPVFFKQSKRGPAQFSPVEMEYAERLVEGDEAPDPDVEIGPPYEDTLSVPSYDYTNKADVLIENEKLSDYKRALTEELSRMEAERVKRDLAQKIIERNRKEGYDIILDKDFNVISVKEIEPLESEAKPVNKTEPEKSK